MRTNEITCPECGHAIGRSKMSTLAPILDTCSSCGGAKDFHLCPVCDQQVMKMRQRRLEKGIIQVKQNQENLKGTLEAQIRVRDYLAERELVKNSNEKRYLFRSIFYGIVMALPLIALGLQMSIQSVMVPLGMFMLVMGFIFLAVAVHCRLLYDKTRDAKRWLWLSKTQKLDEITSVTYAQKSVSMQQSSPIGNLTKAN